MQKDEYSKRARSKCSLLRMTGIFSDCRRCCTYSMGGSVFCSSNCPDSSDARRPQQVNVHCPVLRKLGDAKSVYRDDCICVCAAKPVARWSSLQPCPGPMV